MLLGEVRLGRPLEIYITREDYHYKVMSRIEYAEEGCVCVTLISSGKRVFQFLETDVIDIVYQEQDRMWKWSNVKGAVVTVDGDKLHGFFSNEAGDNYNRRNAFRLIYGKEITVSYLVHDDVKLKSMQEENALSSQRIYNYDKNTDGIREECFKIINCRAYLRDISETGVGIYTNERFFPEDELSFTLQSDFGPIECKAAVIRMKDNSTGSFRHYYGCKFVETSRNLTKFLYEQQRLQLKKSNGFM